MMTTRMLAVCLLALSGALLAEQPDLADEYRRPSQEWPPFEVDEGVAAQELASLPPLPAVPWHTQASEELGKLLFFDPRLSGSGQLACVSCHEPELGWGDGRRVSAGHDRQAGNRNAMTLLGAAHFEDLFWDGRAKGLLDLALQPIQSPAEMNADLSTIIDRLRSSESYTKKFEQAFGTPAVTSEHIAMSIASFLRSIVSRSSRFDRFVQGDYQQLTNEEIEGLHLFRTRARCMNCHSGPRFSDGQFHHTGLSYYGRRFEDLGRFHVTGDPQDRGKFRTPTLRNVGHTGPWMHNGLFTNFTGILHMYNHGITFNSRQREGAPELSPLILPLGLSDGEIAALEAFLHSIGRRPPFVEPPQFGSQ